MFCRFSSFPADPRLYACRLGDEENPGIVGRAVSKLFQAKAEVEELSRGSAKVELSVEMLEIYNEKVRDLLAPDQGEIEVKVTSKSVVGNMKIPASAQADVHQAIDLAQKRRCVKATASNAESSRSHLLFTIHFHTKLANGTVRKGRLNICDLAGSERLGKSGAHVVGVSYEPRCVLYDSTSMN